MKHRLWNKFRAYLGGYFWLPCPLCGKKFGGHEWHNQGDMVASIPVGGGTSKGICPDCTAKGRGRWPTVEEMLR